MHLNLGGPLVFFALGIAIHARPALPNTSNDGYQASFCKRNNETIRIPFSKSMKANIPCKSRNPPHILLYKGSGTSLELINVNASSPWKYFYSESDEHGLLSGFVYEPAKGSDYNSSMLTGMYTCQFANGSNSKDSITVELYEDASPDIVLLYEDPCEIYQANCTEYIFECVVNKDFFLNMFEWYLQRGPDDLTLTTNYNSSESEHNGWFRERIHIIFPSTDITGIGCRAKKANYEWSNQTIIDITVTDWNLPELHNTQTESISYVKGLNLTSEYTPSTCSEKSYVRWEVDGNTSEFHKTFDSYGRSTISVSDASVTQNYTIFIGATSKTYLVEPYRPFPTLVVIASVTLWIGLVAVGVLIVYKKIMGNKVTGTLKMIHLQIERRATALRTKLEWQFDKRDFDNMVKIGTGQYGNVYYVNSRGKDVVVKASKCTEDVSLTAIKTAKMCLDVIREAEIISGLKHPNIVEYLGFYVKPMEHQSRSKVSFADQFYPVLKYYNPLGLDPGLKLGCLENFLKYVDGRRKNGERICDDLLEDISLEDKRRHGYLLGASDLMRFTEHIAAAMGYLEEKKIVHRDLAARNILLHLNENRILTAIVSDFGLARELNPESLTYRLEDPTPDEVERNIDEIKPRALPVLIYPPEALGKNRHYSSKTDVWSFGVLVWEMFAVNKEPYCNFRSKIGYSINELRFKQMLEQQEIGLELNLVHRNLTMPPELWTLIQECFNLDENARPTFAQIWERLKTINQDYEISDHFLNIEMVDLQQRNGNAPQQPNLAYADVGGVLNGNGQQRENYVEGVLAELPRRINQVRFPVNRERNRRIDNLNRRRRHQ